MVVYLRLIVGTHGRSMDQGVEPEMLLVFFGPTVQYLITKPKDKIALEFQDHLDAIAESVSELAKLGVRMEVCNEANKILGIDPNSLLPGLTAVGDGTISLIGWQYQGY